MNKQEFGQLTMAIKGYFPRAEIFKDGFVMEMWFDALKDLDYKVAINSVKLYAQTNKFPPTVADIRESCVTITKQEELGELEAWALVSKAMRNGTYHSQEEFDALPPLIQRAVGSADNLRHWAQSDMDDVETVIASNFQRTYRGLLARAQKVNRLSPDLQIAMGDAQKQKMIGERI